MVASRSPAPSNGQRFPVGNRSSAIGSAVGPAHDQVELAGDVV
jgi:hypothetical protein